MTYVPITSCLAAILALMMVALSFQVSLRRRQLALSHGDGGDQVLRRRIRAHGNFIEYSPLAAIVILLVELAGTNPATVWALGGALVGARVVHALGMLYTKGPALRAAAMVVQHLAFLFGAALLIAPLF